MMKAKLALKLGIIALVIVGSLSGCFLFKSTGTIVFDNYDPVSFNGYVDGEYVWIEPYILPYDGYTYYDVEWTGTKPKTVYVEVTDGLGHNDSGYFTLNDGQETWVTIDFWDL
jgi:hypothetical protein